jgi:hypothetical protein
MFSLLPTIFSRAALFRPGWVGAWTFWALLVALTVAVPLLLARALGATEPSNLAEELRTELEDHGHSSGSQSGHPAST